MQVVNMDTSRNRSVSKRVRRSLTESRFDTAASHEQVEAELIVSATKRLRFRIRGITTVKELDGLNDEKIPDWPGIGWCGSHCNVSVFSNRSFSIRQRFLGSRDGRGSGVRRQRYSSAID